MLKKTGLNFFLIVPLALVLLFSCLSFAQSSKSNNDKISNELLQKVAKKYRSSKYVEMDVEKSVKSELMGRETKFIGRIFLSSGKFRWENSSPEKTLLVFDGTTIWSEQSPPPEFGGPVQVAKGKVDKKNRSHILISSLVGADLNKNFKVIKDTKAGSLTTLEVQPLYDDLTVKDLSVIVDTKQSFITTLSYKDDIGNLTTMKFSNVKLVNKEKKNLFKYQPPQGAQVTDL